jgi:hypothetical protein
MKNSLRCLLLSALLMSLAACSSTVRTVLATPAPPLACLIECPTYPSAPPRTPGLDDWLRWGDDLVMDYQLCAQLHNSCAADTLRQIEDTPSPGVRE